MQQQVADWLGVPTILLAMHSSHRLMRYPMPRRSSLYAPSVAFAGATHIRHLTYLRFPLVPKEKKLLVQSSIKSPRRLSKKMAGLSMAQLQKSSKVAAAPILKLRPEWWGRGKRRRMVSICRAFELLAEWHVLVG